MAAFTKRRQALHDMVVETLVVRRTFGPEAIRGAAPAPTSALRTASVVIAMLLFGPFSIGVLAAIAIPAYQDYTIRAQITAGLNAASPYQAAIAAAAATGVKFANIDSKSLNLTAPTLRYVESIDVAVGAIVITYSSAANEKIRAKSVVLVPALDEQQNILWLCGRARTPEGYRPMVRDAAQYTTVADKFLPLSCRAPAN
jgi:type IV pilus assembly protein PilA